MNMPFNIDPLIIDNHKTRRSIVELTQLEEERSQLLDFMPDQSFDYWSAHFGALLQCMHYHINLSESPMNLSNYPNWSIADLRAVKKHDFFSGLERYLTNWGFQYFLVNFLNNSISDNIRSALLDGIYEVFNPNFREDLIYTHFEISGRDSNRSNISLLSEIDTFPRNIFSKDYNYHICENSDLAFILNNSREYITRDAVAIFGEVEGNKGIKLLNDRFWQSKHRNCLFGIGVVSSKTIASQLKMSNKLYLGQYAHTPSILLSYVKTSLGFKVVVLFQQEHSIIKDYIDAMKFLRGLFLDGKSTHIYEQFSPAFRQAAHILKNGLQTPILQLLDQFAIAPQMQLEGIENPKLKKIVQIHL